MKLTNFYLTSLFLLTITTHLCAQKTLPLPSQSPVDVSYTITEFVDLRKSKSDSVGIVRTGAFNKQEPLILNNSGEALGQAFLNKTRTEETKRKVRFELTSLYLGEDWGTWAESAKASYGIRVLETSNDGYKIVYNDTFTYEETSVEATKLVEETYLKSIDLLLLEVDKILSVEKTSDQQVATKQEEQEEYEFDYTPSTARNLESTSTPSQSSNTTVSSQNRTQFSNEYTGFDITLGYQVGGLTALGAEVEYRFHKVIGVHFGAGLSGFGVGSKFHFKTDQRGGGYLNLSFKDGGFGLMRTAGFEIGTNKLLGKKKKVGFVIQGGFHGILEIDEDLEREIYGNEPAPDVTLMLGIGLNFPL